MRQDDEDFTLKSKKYRKQYLSSLQGLYGNTVPNTENFTKIKRSNKPSRDVSEKYIQMSLVKWARLNGILLMSIPNHGKRNYWTGQQEVAMGLTKGVSDLFLPMMRLGYGGFWLEMKKPGSKPRPDQYDWLDKMREQGYMTGWYDNWEVAKKAIEVYLSWDT